MKLLGLSCAGVVILALAACGGGGNSGDGKSADRSAAIVTDDRAAWQKAAGPDQKLSIEEFGTVVRDMREALDTDGNGELGKAELDALPAQRRGAWAMYDTDGNGTLSAAEAEASIGPKFTMRDRNHDRQISSDEIPDGTPAGGLLF